MCSKVYECVCLNWRRLVKRMRVGDGGGKSKINTLRFEATTDTGAAALHAHLSQQSAQPDAYRSLADYTKYVPDVSRREHCVARE